MGDEHDDHVDDDGPAAGRVDQPIEVPGDAPVEVPHDQPTEVPHDQPVERPGDAPVEVPVEEPSGASAAAEVVGGDGRRRRRTALVVVAVAVATGLLGMLIGSQLQSPADRAAARSAPQPSLITVPVERRELNSDLVLAGTVNYNEPTTVQLAGSVGIAAGETQVVTDAKPVGETINEGDPLIEVTGRPVLVLQGRLPMYRRLVVGTEGPDVLQLEEALVRLGYQAGTVDTVFDAATATAVEQMYADAGYTAEGPSIEERDALTTAQDAVRQAGDNLRSAQAAVAEASEPLLPSQQLELDQSLQSARDAVPAAAAAADSARIENDQIVASAQAALDGARVARDTAVGVRDAARAPGAIDPNTNAPYSVERLAELDVQVAERQTALVDAEAALVTADTQRSQAIALADQAVADAQFQLQLAQARHAEGTSRGDTSALDAAVVSAQQAAEQAQTNLVALQASTGTRISPGELVFVPVLPSTVTESYVTPGAAINGPIGTLATSDTLVAARISRTDSTMVAVGATVELEIRGAGVTTTGTVLGVAAPAPVDDGGQSPGPGASDGGASGRLEVTIAPDDPGALRDFVFWDVRVVVSIDATDGEVLVVPVAALTVGPDETSQVEVERTPATDAEPAVTEVVAVVVGLSSDGLAQVDPVEPGALQEGDRVVIGFETSERRNLDDDISSPEVPDSRTGAGEDPGDRDGGDPADDDGDGGESASPLSELLGFDSDPVEDRRKQLEQEDQVAECMRELGYEYEPVDYSTMFDDPDAELMNDPAAYGEKYGYGVMRSYELYEVGEPVEPQVFVDPNQDYLDSLTPTEQEAYYAALYGEPQEAEPGLSEDGGYVPVPIEQQGCQGKARLAVYGENPADDPEVQAMLEDFWSNQENNPVLDEANDAWAACLAESADEFDLPRDPETPNEMYSLMNRIKAVAAGQEVIDISSEEEMREYETSSEMAGAEFNGDGTGVVYLGQPEEISGEEIERLTELEVELWKADQACQDEAGVKDAQRAAEQDLVDRILEAHPELGG